MKNSRISPLHARTEDSRLPAGSSGGQEAVQVSEGGREPLRERPLLFSGSMVRAILSGQKTQTRRVVNLDNVLTTQDRAAGLTISPDHAVPGDLSWLAGIARDSAGAADLRREQQLNVPYRHPENPDEDWKEDCGRFRVYCPHGTVGDRLWVKETFAPRSDVDPANNPEKARHYCMYRANGGNPRDPSNWHDFGGRWRPSIFMPRVLSRVTLEIVGVRVERVQEISANDCFAEGIARPPFPNFGSDVVIRDNARNEYRVLWDSINAKRGFGWESNPWVWVIEFRRVGEEGK